MRNNEIFISVSGRYPGGSKVVGKEIRSGDWVVLVEAKNTVTWNSIEGKDCKEQNFWIVMEPRCGGMGRV